MTILKISAKNFKNLADEVEIDFVPKARKTSEDKEYELNEIADGLFVFSTMAFVGKNASGKTTALDLISVAYDIVSAYRVEKPYNLNNVEICIYFYDKGYIYKYKTRLLKNPLNNGVVFNDECIWEKQYYKSYVNNIYDDDGFEMSNVQGKLPEDVSKVFLLEPNRIVRPILFNEVLDGITAYDFAFGLKALLDDGDEILKKILKIFDENVSDLRMDESGNYVLNYLGKEEKYSVSELYSVLSSGTTKGIALYMIIVTSLKAGFPILIDEIENHFHKTLVENIISLYKDKTVNKNNAILIFSTHYCEVLDLFNRQDNIYIANADQKVHLNTIFEKYNFRNDILKSKQFYNNAFKTAVNYDALMDLKKALK